MKDLPVILVQGADSARALADRFASEKVKRWIAYDALAQQVLIDRNIPYVDESFYLQSEVSTLKGFQKQAHRLSVEWFRDVPEVECLGGDTARVEGLYMRTFHSFFLSMLCGHHFLGKISEMEGPCRLITTRNLLPGGTEEILFRKREAPLNALLNAFHERWHFNLSYVDVPRADSIPRGKNLLAEFVKKVAGLISRQSVTNKVLLSGNPLLLGPVGQELENRYGVSSVFVRPITCLRDVLQLARPGRLLVPLPAEEVKPWAFDEELLLKRFREKKTFWVDDIDYSPVAWLKIRSFYHQEVRWAGKLYREIQKVLRGVRPDFLIVDEDVIEFNRALVHAANRMGIKTLVVAHGLPGAPSGFLPLQADRVAVWGDFTAAVLKEWGLSSERIVLTGCPKYDRLDPRKDFSVERKILCKKFGWDPKNPIVVIVPGKFHLDPVVRFDGSGSTSTEALKTAHHFMRAAKEVPGINFIYKFRAHSQENQVFKSLIGKNLSPNIQFVHEGLALDYIRASDVVFNNCSSAGLEAILLKKPVISMNFSFHENIFPFRAYGLGASVQSFEETVEICKRLAARSLPLEEWVISQESLVRPFLFSRDRKAAARIASVAGNTLRRSLKTYGQGDEPLREEIPLVNV